MATDDATPIRHTIVFTGRVQGVGFRATTRHIARGHAVTGHVRNEPEGSVLCVAEGERGELKRFRAEIERVMARNIDRTTVTESPATGEFDGFLVGR